jgi:hypothetical protein
VSPKPVVLPIHQLAGSGDVSCRRFEEVSKRDFVLDYLVAFFSAIRVFFQARATTALEVLALRQQLSVLKRKRPKRPLNLFDRLFRIGLRRFFSGWKNVLLIVKPDTVVAWRRASFQWYWRLAISPTPRQTEDHE